jgi:hypothetical protein
MPNRISMTTAGRRQSAAFLRGTLASPGAHLRWSPEPERLSRDELLAPTRLLKRSDREPTEPITTISRRCRLRAGLDRCAVSRRPITPSWRSIADDAAACRLGATIGDPLAISRLDQATCSAAPVDQPAQPLRPDPHTYTSRRRERDRATSDSPTAGAQVGPGCPSRCRADVHADPTLLQRVMENWSRTPALHPPQRL